MVLFFQIVGGFLLALVILALALLWWVRWRLRRLGRDLSSALESLAQMKPEPSEIHLEAIDEPTWTSEDDAKTQIHKLRQRGFSDERCYRVRETPEVEIWAGVNRSACVYGAVFRHPAVGVWVDLVSACEDGTWATWSNSPSSGLERPPGKPIHRVEDFDAGQLYERMLRERPDAAMKPVSADQFAANVERYHAEEMAWRNSRGGPSEQEIRSVAQLSGQTLDDETLGLARKVLAENARTQLIESLRNTFMHQTTLTASEWEKVRDRLVFVYEGMTPDEVRGLMSLFVEDEDDENERFVPEFPAGMTARAGFAVMNDRLAAELKFERLDEVSDPVLADVYVAPREP